MEKINQEFILNHKILCTPSIFGGYNLKSADFRHSTQTENVEIYNALMRIACLIPGDILTKEDINQYKKAWMLLKNAN